MFKVRAQSVFSAAHALLLGGEREPLHGHDWRVRVTIAGPTLNDDLLLWDFHQLEADLGEVIAPFRNANLNQISPFDHMNPSAEAVARHIGDALSGMLQRRLARYPKIPGRWPAGLRIDSVSVTEAPGCEAVYLPDAPEIAG